MVALSTTTEDAMIIANQMVLVAQVENSIHQMNQMELMRLFGAVMGTICKRDPHLASRVMEKFLQAKVKP
jgi:hypothetical protein